MKLFQKNSNAYDHCPWTLQTDRQLIMAIPHYATLRTVKMRIKTTLARIPSYPWWTWLHSSPLQQCRHYCALALWCRTVTRLMWVETQMFTHVTSFSDGCVYVCRQVMKELFNVRFGSLFRSYHNPTYFTRRLNRFADIYTSSLVNFLKYPLNYTFYPQRTALPHELVSPDPDITIN